MTDTQTTPSIQARWINTTPSRNEWGQYTYGTYHRTKLLNFLTTLTPEELKSLPNIYYQLAQRQPEEDFQEYKNRMKLSKQLIRFRHRL